MPHSIPVYGLNEFRKENLSQRYQVEVFDANRHFQVSYPHRHDFYEVLFLTKGSGIHIIDSNEYRIEPPCIFFMSPGQAHKLDLSHDIEGFIFLFTAEFYLLNHSNKNRLLEFPFFFSVAQTNPPLYLKNNTDRDFITQLFRRGCTEIENRDNHDDEIVRGILDLILLSCNKLYSRGEAVASPKKGDILVKNFLKLLEENFQQNLRIQDYADILAITANHLTETVRLTTGRTPNAFLQDKLVLEIKRLLIHSDMPISEIADSLHFTDQSYFTKFFKKYTGLTPLQFRKGR